MIVKEFSALIFLWLYLEKKKKEHWYLFFFKFCHLLDLFIYFLSALRGMWNLSSLAPRGIEAAHPCLRAGSCLTFTREIPRILVSFLENLSRAHFATKFHLHYLHPIWAERQ